MQLPDAGTYTVLVSNPGGSVSASASLNVTTLPTTLPPVIIAGPQSQTVPTGSDVSLSVQASGSELTYQWQHNGTDIAGATASTLNLADVQLTDAGIYTVLVSNPAGAVSSSASLTVTSGTALQPPVIIAGPQSQTALAGTDVSFTVQATGSELLYQWQHNGTDIAGATTSALNLADVQLTDAGSYTVLVSNPAGAVNASATLNVNSGTTLQPPVILSGPQSQTVPVGADVSFTVQATGAELLYQWQHNGTDIAGATTSILTLTEVPLSAAGTYTVWVANAGGNVSSSASLTVTSGTTLQPPAILTGPQSQTVPAGTDVTFTVQASGDGALLPVAAQRHQPRRRHHQRAHSARRDRRPGR